jgi:hypothetical protein
VEVNSDCEDEALPEKLTLTFSPEIFQADAVDREGRPYKKHIFIDENGNPYFLRRWKGQTEPRKSRRELLWIKEGKKCHWCGCRTRICYDHSWDKATIDHVIPRYKQGSNDDSNVVSACNLCNNRRSHEDAKGLPEGALLGVYKVKTRRVVLSGDEKRAIIGKHLQVRNPESLITEQRDQCIAANLELRRALDMTKAALEVSKKEVDTIPVMKFIRRRLALWLSRGL